MKGGRIMARAGCIGRLSGGRGRPQPVQVCARLNSGHVTLWEILNHYYYEKVLE